MEKYRHGNFAHYLLAQCHTHGSMKVGQEGVPTLEVKENLLHHYTNIIQKFHTAASLFQQLFSQIIPLVYVFRGKQKYFDRLITLLN